MKKVKKYKNLLAFDVNFTRELYFFDFLELQTHLLCWYFNRKKGYPDAKSMKILLSREKHSTLFNLSPQTFIALLDLTVKFI